MGCQVKEREVSAFIIKRIFVRHTWLARHSQEKKHLIVYCRNNIKPEAIFIDQTQVLQRNLPMYPGPWWSSVSIFPFLAGVLVRNLLQSSRQKQFGSLFDFVYSGGLTLLSCYPPSRPGFIAKGKATAWLNTNIYQRFLRKWPCTQIAFKHRWMVMNSVQREAFFSD